MTKPLTDAALFDFTGLLARTEMLPLWESPPAARRTTSFISDLTLARAVAHPFDVFMPVIVGNNRLIFFTWLGKDQTGPDFQISTSVKFVCLHGR